jgi:hypothetical protein
MLPRKPGTSTIAAKCMNLNTKMDDARMAMFRVFKNARFKIGFGWKIRLRMAAATRKSPAMDIATIVPEFNQSSRCP